MLEAGDKGSEVANDDAARITGVTYSVGTPLRGLELIRWKPGEYKRVRSLFHSKRTHHLLQGGPITVYYNPKDRRESTLVPGIPFALVNTLAFAFGVIIFFLPLLPNKRFSKAALTK